MDQQKTVYPYSGAPLSNKEEKTAATVTTWKNPKTRLMKKPSEEDHIVCDSIYRKRLESENLKTQSKLVAAWG